MHTRVVTNGALVGIRGGGCCVILSIICQNERDSHDGPLDTNDYNSVDCSQSMPSSPSLSLSSSAQSFLTVHATRPPAVINQSINSPSPTPGVRKSVGSGPWIPFAHGLVPSLLHTENTLRSGGCYSGYREGVKRSHAAR